MPKFIDVPNNVKQGILSYLLQKKDSYVARELIKEELDKKGIKCDNLSEVLEAMTNTVLLETDKPKSSKENLYKITEVGRMLFLTEKEK